MRRRLLSNAGKYLEGTITEDYQVGNIVLYDKQAGNKIVIDITKPTTVFDSNRYLPLAVIMIPKSHNVYGTGKTAAISLVNMSCKSPNKGIDSVETMQVGSNSMTTSYTSVASIGYHPNQDLNTTTAITNDISLPLEGISMNSKRNICLTDEKCIYTARTGYPEYYYAAPSPYLNDGSRNPIYYKARQVFTDFSGIDNSVLLQNYATTQSNWRENVTITSSSDTGYSPPACCCWRFCPEGTNQGDWYLPSAGELGYFLVRQKTIEDSIQYIIDSGYSGTVSTGRIQYCTSTRANSLCVILDGGKGGNGDVFSGSLTSNYTVRAIIQI